MPSRLKAFATNAAYRRALGPGFQGVRTNWRRLREAAQLAATLVNWLGSTTGRALLRQGVSIANRLSEIEDRADQLDQLGREFIKLLSQGAAGPHESLLVQPRDSARQFLERIRATLDRLLGKIERIRPNEEDTLDNISQIAIAASNLCALRTRIEELVGKPSFLATAHRGIHHTPLDPLRTTLDCVRRLISLRELPTQCTVWLLEAESADRLVQLRNAVGKLASVIEVWRNTSDELASFAKIDCSSAVAANQERNAAETVAAYEAATAAVSLLPQWADYTRVRKWFIDHRNDDLLRFLTQHGLPVQMLARLACAAFWNGWLRVAEENYPGAFELARHEKETARQSFQSGDRLLPHHNRDLVAREVYRPRGDIAPGRYGPRAADLTNLALIEREIKKRRKHVPAREIVRRSGHALQQLMPCWMMSPGAVAQFLPPGQIEFDLLVVDEASQVRPEDSLGSLARAKQVVIVGDSKQMPPSDVFWMQSDPDEEEEDDAAPAEELESVLDVFSNFVPAPSLSWHYRSQHHSLILYSNEFFYDRGLLVPPSTQLGDGPLGVKWHYCQNANFVSRRNPVEAEEVVRQLSQHVIIEARKPIAQQESVAVVTMNRTQQELIEELFDRKTREWPDLASALESFKPVVPLIIRNLENMQGEERDVVIISFTYGPDPASGKVAQRFPLVNRAGGWRRLNVLFSRARLRTIVVSSMKSEDILPRTEGAEDGVVHLRNYLKFAQTGCLPDAPDGPRREPDTEFERSVARVVQGLGFDVHFQVGTLGFLIDIAVPDPVSPTRYLCGIECDGAPYHSHPTARDRDRLREEILRARGWDIFRIWSTDWYRNRTTEVDRLRNYLRNKAGMPEA